MSSPEIQKSEMVRSVVPEQQKEDIAMVTIRVLGTSEATTEKQMQAIAEDLQRLFVSLGEASTCVYVEFPTDRMKMDLGAEIIAQVFGAIGETGGWTWGQLISVQLYKHFPQDTKIGVQLIEARTARQIMSKA